jgi:hypothetical protein
MNVSESQPRKDASFQHNFDRLSQRAVEINIQKEAAHRRLIEERWQEQEKERAYQEWKEAQFPEALENARYIFNWVSSFIEQRKAGEIFDCTGDKEIIIWEGQYFHCKPGNFGSMAAMYMIRGGILLYRESFKWMRNCGNCFDFEDAEQMARELHPDYIREVYDYIRTDKVWRHLLLRMERADRKS